MAIYSNNNPMMGDAHIYNFGKESNYFKRKKIGSRSDYLMAVVPLVNLDNSDPSRFSYTAGRMEMIRTNGCCYQGDVTIDFIMQKPYNSTSYYWRNIHTNGSYAVPCTFTYQGTKWGGIRIWYNVQEHDIYFSGFSTEALDKGYLTYYNSSTSSVTNSEIYNSLVLGTA